MQRPPSNARWTLVVALCVAGTVIAEPLPSWNDGAPKQALVEFVARVTRESSPDYVKPAERIAVFDNDGTLWAEQPLYFQFVFAMDRIRTLAPAPSRMEERRSPSRRRSRATPARLQSLANAACRKYLLPRTPG